MWFGGNLGCFSVLYWGFFKYIVLGFFSFKISWEGTLLYSLFLSLFKSHVGRQTEHTVRTGKLSTQTHLFTTTKNSKA